MSNTEFNTSDMTLAAYLLATNHQLTNIRKAGHKGTFYFRDVDPATITSYDMGNGQVEPVTFHNAVKQLTTAVRRSADGQQ